MGYEEANELITNTNLERELYRLGISDEHIEYIKINEKIKSYLKHI